MNVVYRYDKGRLSAGEKEVVAEVPLLLNVNGREMATLIASPHDLRFLVAGFLRLQGLVERVEDFDMLSVCNDFGIARVQIKGELPETLKPVLTSGCGTGISFTIPQAMARKGNVTLSRRFAPRDVFAMMDAMAQKAEGYRSHGGIHSAAVGDGSLCLFAEDLGRHNTIDRIAGEALLKGIDLTGMMLVTSGRISTELVAKAALLGIGLVASRTSPTETAVKMATEAGITLIGYVRAERFEIFSHRDRLDISEHGGKIKGMTGVILAGGASSRMGNNKALLLHRGGRLIEGIYRKMSELFEEVIVVTNRPELYQFLPCRKVPDIYPGKGVLAGIHGALSQCSEPAIFTVACDMPQLNGDLIRHLAEQYQGVDVVIPKSDGGFEPIHAIYGKGCIPVLEELLQNGEQRVLSLLPLLMVREVEASEVALFDQEFNSFVNINTPEDYYKLRSDERETAEQNTPRLRQSS
ncbi:formate dehydrogenase accessory sulfurtransferase FdhD [Geobacter sp.]|uniref:formate dehydrogenase accessory sulfurtransferase FdhD n=1 Tax=Geobacter sp. TaxID=46610 RepID=UPI001AD3CC45|nr:formate dehydrogenase accessory sulfurtransferase FdhD [Geobacter sp.]CAG0987682.1 Sulfur carrier protein FdhD [Geobacteraceae bacterium]